MVCIRICRSVRFQFWPSGDQSFADFPPAVKRVVLPQTGGIDFLAPLSGAPQDSFPLLWGRLLIGCLFSKSASETLMILR